MAVTPQILNEAMSVYVQTFSMRDRLAEHITSCGLEQHRDEIVSELDAVLKTAEDHLYDYPGGVPWTAAFEGAYRELLVEKHRWLDTKSLDRVFAFSRWLCWHEGLNAEGVV
jgi:hypothetical protein